MSLVTLQDYKEYHGISSTTNDTRLELLVDLVSELVEAYLGRKILTNTYTDQYYEYLGGYVYRSNFPITTVSKFETYDTGNGDWTEWVVADDVFLSEDDGILEVINDDIKNYVSTKRSKPVRVTYDGGYSTTPSDLKLAIFDLITYYNKREQTPAKSFNSQSVDTSAGLNGSEMPAHIKRVLALYRVRD